MNYGRLRIMGVVVAIALMATSCGRKQRNVFNFVEHTQPKINRFILPSVKGVQAQRHGKDVYITWRAVEAPHDVVGVGYNVYRLAQGRFIPKVPLNKKPITDTQFIDKHHRRHGAYCYVVRAVFRVQNQTVQGLTSQVVSCP